MTSCSVAAARDELTRLIREAEEGQTIHITRRGKAVAVLLSEVEYQRLIESMPHKGFAERVREMRAQPDFEPVDLTPGEVNGWRDRGPGRTFSWDE